MIEQLFRGLLRIDHDLNVVPELAQNMNVSADGLTYLFMLREDACWSDGHPLTAGDFVYAWTQLREEGHITAFLLDDIASAEALDDWTLEVHLREPRNYFPYVLASHWAYPWPRHRADEVGAAWRRPESLVGNGPFVLAAVDETGALLTANPHWRSASGNVGEVRIVFRERERRSRRSATGSPGATTWSSPRGAPVAAARRHRSRSARRRSRRRSSASTSGNELMADERVRQALAHAIDRAALLADSPGVDLAAERGGAIPPVMPGHGDGAGLPYDPERARELLAEAGYPGGEGLPEIVIAAPPVVAARRRSADSSPRSASARAPRCPRSAWASLAGVHAWFTAWHADYPDPDGFYLGLLELGHAALPRRRDGRRARAGARLARPRRAAAPVPRVRARVDRPARGARAALVRAASSCCAGRTSRP